jgi:hypothetical protein
MTLLGRLPPPIALMAVIFALSAQPDLNSGLGTVDLAIAWWLWRALDVRHTRQH